MLLVFSLQVLQLKRQAFAQLWKVCRFSAGHELIVWLFYVIPFLYDLQEKKPLPLMFSSFYGGSVVSDNTLQWSPYTRCPQETLEPQLRLSASFCLPNILPLINDGICGCLQ